MSLGKRERAAKLFTIVARAVLKTSEETICRKYENVYGDKMVGNKEKYKADIEDGKVASIKNLSLLFYYKEPQESFFEIRRQLSGISMIVLGMDTKVNTPEEIVTTIVGAVKKNPDIQYFVTILYNDTDEKKKIISGIMERLGLKENEVLENIKRQTNG